MCDAVVVNVLNCVIALVVVARNSNVIARPTEKHVGMVCCLHTFVINKE
jgi:hypothetical protein